MQKLVEVFVWLVVGVFFSGVLSAPTRNFAVSKKEAPKIVLVDGFPTAFSHQLYVGD